MDVNGSGLTSVDYRTGERAAKGVLLVACAALFFGVLNASAVAIVLPKIGVAALPGLGMTIASQAN